MSIQPAKTTKASDVPPQLSAGGPSLLQNATQPNNVLYTAKASSRMHKSKFMADPMVPSKTNEAPTVTNNLLMTMNSKESDIAIPVQTSGVPRH